ncbi:MAG: GNAT family N-acetyltransferase [Anaerolineae bacterium]|nr:GNAT family N-acetyltransferase [Anaerolineae bacterium]
MTARLAHPADRPLVHALLAGTWRRHGSQMLDDQATLLQSGLSAIALLNGSAVGFLGVTLRAPAGSPAEVWADLGLVAVDDGQPVQAVLAAMLQQALPVLRANGCTGLVCLTGQGWLREELRREGFTEIDRVLSYVHDDPAWAPGAPAVAHLRPAGPADIDTILALNAAAFAPLWRYGDATVITWLLTSQRAVIAYLPGRPVGFALASHTNPGNYAHLIRVAVHPEAQGRGIGRQLVLDGLRFAQEVGAAGLALNTQASNTVSQRLYKSLGFRPVEPVLSVLVYRP